VGEGALLSLLEINHTLTLENLTCLLDLKTTSTNALIVGILNFIVRVIKLKRTLAHVWDNMIALIQINYTKHRVLSSPTFVKQQVAMDYQGLNNPIVKRKFIALIERKRRKRGRIDGSRFAYSCL
jgi:hypothetical protein